MLSPWLIFLISAAVIVLAGTKLSDFGDRIADQTGLGGLWIGTLLMAVATSLPEVFTTVSAALMEIPNLAAGDLLGAVMTNMLTLGIIDQVYRKKRVWERAAVGHALVASLAMVLVALAGFFVLLRSNLAVWQVGVDSLVLIIIYILGMRVVYRQENLERNPNQQEGTAEGGNPDGETASRRRSGLWRSGVGFAVSALGILAAAPFLASSAQQIAEITGVSTTFIGTSLVAVTTSLPELVTALAAVRLGAIDLAVGNLFGSNAFNMAAFFFADVAYRQGSLLGSVSPTHSLTAMCGILLMNIGILGMMYKAEKRRFLIEPDSRMMILGFMLGMWVLFR